MYKVRFYNEAPIIIVERRDESVVCTVVEEGLDGKPWFYDIKWYLKKQEYPENASA
ncbi:hypothetical protein A2U01_0112307, partial [Trifolium medium]|nr:hypothetical protein [Trifolium medium]